MASTRHRIMWPTRDASWRWPCVQRSSRRIDRRQRPGAGGRPHGRGRRRSGALLAAVARAVRAGARQPAPAIPIAGRRRRTCCGRPRFPAAGNSSPIVWRDRIFLTTARDGGRRLSLLAYNRARRHAAVGDVRARRPERSAASQERLRLGDAGDRRRARLRLVRQPRTVRVRSERQAASGSAISGAIDNYHGAAGSPLLYKDRVILYQDQSRGGVHRGLRQRAPASRSGARRDSSRSAGARRSRSASAITTRSSSTASRA